MVIAIIQFLKVAFFFFFLNSCSNFKPLYKNDLSSLYKLQEFSIVTDQKEISNKIKKNLIELFPINKKTIYILKIEGFSETTGTVSDSTR